MAGLAVAETVLAPAFMHTADSSAGSTESSLSLERVRAYCSKLRAAVVELDSVNSVANVETARDYCSDLRAAFLEMGLIATLPFHCDEPICAMLRSPRTACWIDCLEDLVLLHSASGTSASDWRLLPAPADPVSARRYDRAYRAQRAEAQGALPGPSLARQAVGLLALILAYLAYYHIDVQLQILHLPSLFP
ncbi:MAG: hypothetical protein IH606_14835 [Burkholderiales bacterium]|nr:hypothetical protein [Burkholderiales bacterium]